MNPATPSLQVRLSRVPATVTSYELQAGKDEREHLTQLFGLLELRHLHAALTLSPWSNGGAIVSGTVDADFSQQCVASLEPIDLQVEFAISRRFLPDAAKPTFNTVYEDGELILDPEGEDEPDICSDDTLDLWAVVLEEFDLQIEPFPRKAGFLLTESPESVIESEKIDKQRPFADLKERIAGKFPNKD